MTFKDILGGPKRLISDPGRVLNWQAQMATEASRHHGGGVMTIHLPESVSGWFEMD